MNPGMERLALADIEEALIGCDEFLAGYVDVVDGPNGQPAPNAAMSLQAQVREAMQKLDLVYALKAPMPTAEPVGCLGKECVTPAFCANPKVGCALV